MPSITAAPTVSAEAVSNTADNMSIAFFIIQILHALQSNN